MRRVIRWAINNSPAMNTLLIATLLVGAVSMIVMRREVFPEFELEIVLVTVAYPGASPEETEKAICEKVEAAVKDVQGIRKLTSVAREGMGFVIMELSTSVKDVQKVVNEVRSQIEQIPSFPVTAEQARVQQIVFRAPAINVGILAPEETGLDPIAADLQLRELAEQVRDEILQLTAVQPEGIRGLFAPLIASTTAPAISSAEIIAARPYQIDVEVPEENLRDYRLSLEQVAQIIRSQNMELPGGKMETASQELLVRGQTRKEWGKDIEEIVLMTLPNGDTLRVKDIGTVNDSFADSTSEHLIDGRPGLVIRVSRTSDEDLLTVVDTVKNYVANKTLPEGYTLKVWQDLSVDVRDRINLLYNNGMQGLILVFIVLALFLDLRLAFWVAMGIPITILGAGFVLLFMGQTLNMLSMFAFLMALGIVVDDAIVIGENIYTKRNQGMDFVKAAVEGTVEVLPSVVASVCTTIIAFLPLMFITGVMGKFLAVMPIAVICMLIISLVESTFILPCHLAHDHNLFLRMLGGVFYLFKFLLIPFKWLNGIADKTMTFMIDRCYTPLLRFSVNNVMIVVATAFAILFASFGFVFARIVPFEAFPKLDSRNISGTIVFPDGTAAQFARQATEEMEKALLRVDEKIREKYGKSAVDVVYRRIGEVSGGGANPTGVTNGSHVGTVEVELVTTADRDITSQEIVSMWRNELPEIPGVEVVKFGEASMGPGGNQIEFKLLASGDSAKFLELVAQDCKDYLATKLGVSDIEDDARLGSLEMILKLNDEGQSLGLNQEQLYRTVRNTYFGFEVMRVQRGRHDVKLMVRYPEEQRRSFENFEEIRVRDSSGSEIPLMKVVDIDFNRAFSEISRLNQKRSITITADVDKMTGANAANIIQEMRTEFLPQLLDNYRLQKGANIYVDWGGQAQQTAESLSSMMVGFIIAIFCMFILLTLEFRSYLQPMIILATIPFGFVGAILGHWVMGLEMTLFSMFGLVALSGVVVNDSIVLVDFINHRLQEGMKLTEALVEAGRRRFRAVLLTSFTTIAGLFPIMLERSFQAQVLIPLAVSLVFGLATGTIFILVLVPTFYRIYLWWLFLFGTEHKEPVLTRLEKVMQRPEKQLKSV
ncbi:MAG TPA: efflux RND transporter permease subunit [Pirellulaceae bacterium]|nr:efflux RND transporter permease subunit [Pirellulaceae bacterium]HMO91054.1 efflux RND transporter permease subunit [Pirellulaceae bacterium]HMP68169.1 efflux RND transporter permease subunit [Pirellulaceae bacterium]